MLLQFYPLEGAIFVLGVDNRESGSVVLAHSNFTLTPEKCISRLEINKPGVREFNTCVNIPPSVKQPLLSNQKRYQWLANMIPSRHVKGKVCIQAKSGAHQAGAYRGCSSMKRPGVFLLAPGWDASLSQGYPAALNSPIPIYTHGRRMHCESKGSSGESFTLLHLCCIERVFDF